MNDFTNKNRRRMSYILILSITNAPYILNTFFTIHRLRIILLKTHSELICSRDFVVYLLCQCLADMARGFTVLFTKNHLLNVQFKKFVVIPLGVSGQYLLRKLIFDWMQETQQYMTLCTWLE